MLLGEHDHTLDEKNRLTLPAKYRQTFRDGVVVSRGLDGCLNVHATEEWQRHADRIQALDSLSRESRMMQRHLFSGAVDVELDKQGRVVIPASLLEAAEIQREVTVTGVYDHLEIWDRAKWRVHLHELEGSAEDVAERLAN